MVRQNSTKISALGVTSYSTPSIMTAIEISTTIMVNPVQA
jgi:hypothetical protein